VSRIDNFGVTEDVAITVLVDNLADLIADSTDTVIRYTDKPLLAEHGLAALIDLKEAGLRILWDAGMTRTALLENIRRMEIDLTTIDRIALSHGHRDHTGAMTDAIKAIGVVPECRYWDKDATVDEMRRWAKGSRVPLVAHPAAFRERWRIRKDGSRVGPAVAPRDEWEAAGAEVILSEGPYQLGPGCWTTGGVPRRSFEKAGTPSTRHYREGDEFIRDHLDDDQSIVINVKDKGLVIVAGCAHSGIVNTVSYAQEISGVEQVWAIIGGFHLAPASEGDIQRTIDELARDSLRPKMIVPSHCTGFNAIRRFASRMPDEFVLGTVGTTYLV
jgi:7,8-dihydropterin-6-yl-methyl-4-(beta-D-ribofuranosyl)aminobenzene 5'-phosphate synthase